jgi:uncharacterized membrane protein required for colicin V production
VEISRIKEIKKGRNEELEKEVKMQLIQGNWVDLIVIIVLAYFVSEAWRFGFWVVLADFISFLLALFVALSGYQFIGNFLRANFSLSHSLSNALGFLITAALAEGIISFALTRAIRKIPYKFWKKPWSKFFAIVPAIGQGMILLSFILILVLGLPLSPNIKSDISSSKIGGVLVQETAGLEARINEVFGGIIEDSLTYLTVKPGSKDVIPISVDKRELSFDESGEAAMFRLVNEERRKVGVGELKWRPVLVGPAREHATNMWEEEYFGHISPGGENVGDRLDKKGIEFSLAGENLALAPTVETAHRGLMNSEGHRENILDEDYQQIGIGVVDNGVYGKMFVQVFSD